MVLEGNASRLYELDAQLETQRRLLPQLEPNAGLLPFNYPPTTAVPLCLLVKLSRSTAFYTWSALQLVLLGLLVRQFLLLSECKSAEQFVLLLATLTAFPAVFVSLQMGQLSILVLVALAGWVLAMQENRVRLTALCLVMATIKPQLAITAVVITVADRRWRVLFWSTLLGLAWVAVATVFTDWQAWWNWLSVLRRSAGEAGQLGIFPERMYCLKCILFGILGRDHMGLVNTLSFGLLALTLVILSMMWIANWYGFRQRLALSLLLGTLVIPHLNPADAVVYALPTLLGAKVIRAAWLWSALVLMPTLFLIDCYGAVKWSFGLRPFLVAMIGLTLFLLRPVRETVDTVPSPLP